MATSVFFNNFNSFSEQGLIEDLVIESIRVYGHDVFYLPRTLVAKDDLYGEDSISQYKSAYEVEVYIKSYNSYEGDGQFLSKFNLEIRDQITLTIALRTFNNEIGSIEMLDRPQEGDLIYLPMADRLFAIKYVNKTPVFYQLGQIQMYDLVCEMFEYSSERFSTGIAAIDNIEKELTIDMTAWGILTKTNVLITDNNGFVITQSQYDWQEQVRDPYEDNTELEQEGDAIINFTEVNPFSEGNL